MRTLLATAATLMLTALATGARAQAVDWKFYGGAQADADGQTVCFYDEAGVKRRPDVHIEVWTKCVLQADLRRVDIEKDYGGKIMEAAAGKVAAYYIPPIAAAAQLETDQLQGVVIYEATADIADLKSKARFLWELDCRGKLQRTLSAFVESHGKTGSSDKPGDWKHVPPEGNGATLLALLCPMT